ncbi:D-aminoacyl-tRNA deacylase [Parahalioglobus pacificus]|uniref:D-aminoacyl-tRNA deacylase n=1 Tax=Parahalioglobus pacificus TaxID=930806 RepID=A0A918XJG9_9GAMM|nr:D-aminoacyl-tRNA deacylase [Halioglobus pacificus]GHD34165.1 D-aminoacyl-tRNA deacylase [Halioglobus pacificus]
MKALLQRVSEARVTVADEVVGEIGPGLLVLLGLDKGDDLASAKRLLDKVLAYRVFADDQGRMNRSVSDTGGGVLLVSQFTLSADTARGLRPSFSSAMAPDDAKALFGQVLTSLKAKHSPVAAGVFGADMQVSLTNDGPVTFLLES